jgi:hypothetical protein
MVGEILPLTGFRTLSGMNANHHWSRCLSSPKKTLKSATMLLGVSKAEGGCKVTLATNIVENKHKNTIEL